MPQLLALIFTILVIACNAAPPPLPGPASTSVPANAARDGSRHLAIAIDEELGGLGPGFYRSPAGSGAQTLELYHATLTSLDERGNPVPRLAAELPSLDDGSWKLLADGTMLTTYRLRRDVLWHDGIPFTADDVVFGFQSQLHLREPDLRDDPLRAIVRLEAADPYTVLIYWTQPHWAANAVRETMIPYPRRLLQDAQTGGREALLEHPYWGPDYVGLGPFRVEEFVRGSHVELSAFDGYFLGRPRIDSITLRLNQSRAAIMAGLQANAVDVALAASWGAPEAMDLRAAWESQSQGTVLTYPSAATFALFTRGRARANVPDLDDVLLRRALAVAISRQQTNFAQSLGLIPPPVAWIPPSDPRWEEARLFVHDEYAYNPSRSFQLLADAGWTRTTDGNLRNAQGQELVLELQAVDAQAIQAVVARYWSEIGVQLDLTQAPPETTQGRSTPRWPRVLLVTSGLNPHAIGRQAYPPTPGGFDAQPDPSRWAPEFDDLLGRYRLSLRLQDRLAVERELVRVVTRDVPLLPLGFRPAVMPVASGVSGPLARSGIDLRPWVAFNAHEWTKE